MASFCSSETSLKFRSVYSPGTMTTKKKTTKKVKLPATPSLERRLEALVQKASDLEELKVKVLLEFPDPENPEPDSFINMTLIVEGGDDYEAEGDTVSECIDYLNDDLQGRHCGRIIAMEEQILALRLLIESKV